LLAARASLERARAPSTLRLTPRKPSVLVSTGRKTDETDAKFSPGRAAARVCSFHNATIFLTEAGGESDRGEVCGPRNPDGGVMEVRVNVSVSE
jgi:hypothetical protein